MGKWFEDWFASDLYLEVYKHRDETDAQNLFNLIDKSIHLKKTALILDAACGAGRYTILLKEIGFNVVGFDLSLPLLKTARSNYMELDNQHQFFRADLREVQLKKRFDLILNVFTSFGYFESDKENFAFASNAFNFLKEDGYFVFDFLNKFYLEENLVPETKRESNGLIIKEHREISNNRVVKNIEISDESKQHKFVESVKLYSYEEIVENFKKIGYKVQNVFGSYFGEEFKLKDSERVIIFFQK